MRACCGAITEIVTLRVSHAPRLVEAWVFLTNLEGETIQLYNISTISQLWACRRRDWISTSRWDFVAQLCFRLNIHPLTQKYARQGEGLRTPIQVSDSLYCFRDELNHLEFRSKNDLAKQLTELKGELLALRVQKIAGGSASKLTKMCENVYTWFHLDTNPFSYCSNTVRKSIARVLTVTNQKARQNLREFYKGKKYLPLDLRVKKTRAIRRRLTPVSVKRSSCYLILTVY